LIYLDERDFFSISYRVSAENNREEVTQWAEFDFDDILNFDRLKFGDLPGRDIEVADFDEIVGEFAGVDSAAREEGNAIELRGERETPAVWVNGSSWMDSDGGAFIRHATQLDAICRAGANEHPAE
jgi:hypothetical protein